MEYIYGTILKKIPINISYACYKNLSKTIKNKNNIIYIYNFLKLKTSSYSNPCYIIEVICAYIIYII